MYKKTEKKAAEKSERKTSVSKMQSLSLTRGTNHLTLQTHAVQKCVSCLSPATASLWDAHNASVHLYPSQSIFSFCPLCVIPFAQRIAVPFHRSIPRSPSGTTSNKRLHTCQQRGGGGGEAAAAAVGSRGGTQTPMSRLFPRHV